MTWFPPPPQNDATEQFLQEQQQPLFYSRYTGQSAFAGTSSLELEDFAGAKLYC